MGLKDANLPRVFSTRNPLLRDVAEGLCALWAWTAGFAAVPPLVVRRYSGTAKLYFEPVWSPFSHPYRVTFDDEDGSVDVAGGVVYDGARVIEVDGLSGVALGAGDKIWLSIHYHNDPAATDVVELVAGEDWPEDDYAADDLPDGTPTSLPADGWSTTILRVAEITAGGKLVQYLYEDPRVPKGGTYRVTLTVGFRLEGTMFQAIQLVETRVNGVPLPLASAPVAVDLFDTGPCPSASSGGA